MTGGDAPQAISAVAESMVPQRRGGGAVLARRLKLAFLAAPRGHISVVVFSALCN